MPEDKDKAKRRRKQVSKVAKTIADGLDKIQDSGIIESGKDLFHSVGKLFEDDSKEENKQ